MLHKNSEYYNPRNPQCQNSIKKMAQQWSFVELHIEFMAKYLDGNSNITQIRGF